MNIEIKDVGEGMILEVDGEQVVIDEVWPDQGEGLGIMLKGMSIKKATRWEQRFINTNEEVRRIMHATNVVKPEPVESTDG